MPQWMFALLTALLAAALVLAALWLPAAEPIATALYVTGAALVAGHAGWWLGRRASAAATAQPPASLALPDRRPARPAAGTNPPPTEAAAATSALSAPAADRATLGRYRIERELGRGAMGAVYLGLDPQIGRRVAIKTMALSREFAGEELADARMRFFREAETAGRLQHPDIVTIFDAGEDQELAYIAMEYVKGRDLLPHTVAGQLLPLPVVLDIAARVAQALAYAHSQGVVHRDIKPANVMVDLASGFAKDGSVKDASVKVTDFGIARIADASRTRTGMVLGTPSFMSPEQMAGRRVDGRTDLYSLGVMLFQLLTGALPHRSDSMAKLMYQIANETAPDVRTLRPELPESLAHVIARALEKRVDVRYAEGEQMAADLRAVLASIPPVGAAVSPSVANLANAAESSAFQATTKLDRTDPRHNSGL